MAPLIHGGVHISHESLLDRVALGLLGSNVSLQLVSVDIDPETGDGKRTPSSELKVSDASSPPADTLFSVEFSVPQDFGSPGAILIRSEHPREFFLELITLQLPADAGEIHFPCNSWVNPSKTYPGPRIFFSNQVYLTNQTPPGLAKLRREELEYLRGDGTGERKKGERIYDYDLYNNVGNPDKDPKLARPVLGGSKDLPYPRRCRTGGKHTKTDPVLEEPSASTYVPRDDEFSPLKSRDVTAAGIRATGHEAQTLLAGEKHFSTFEEIYNLYAGKLDPSYSLQNPEADGTIFKFPPPTVVQANRDAWMTDEEFARQRLAGMNPIMIERLKVFPPESRLDPEVYGREKSCITANHIEDRLEGLTVEEALHEKRLFILDYHDCFITPYLARINETESKAYGSRTLFFLTKAGVLLPIVIELLLPPEDGEESWQSRVFTPPSHGTVDWLWQLAKAHVAIVDAAYQHLCGHWLRTHACMEPFVIATHRHLSALHPLQALLTPHFKDTMNANSGARESFLNSGGRIEKCFGTGKYSNEVSSIEYKRWRFDEQALPKDLIKRGMAEEDSEAEHGLRLAIEDYPYAADGLDLWAAIRQWVGEYVSIYYEEEGAVEGDEELQEWWREVKEEGHGDHKEAEWWKGPLRTAEEVAEVAATLLWVATGLHAVVDFGQYPFAGFMPNGPTMGRRLIPPPESAEMARLMADPPAYFLASLATQRQAATTMSTFEITSQHLGDEAYLGAALPPFWSCDTRILAAHSRFRSAIARARDAILARSQLPHAMCPHRSGPSRMPFTLLLPFAPDSVGGSGVANSISI